MEDAYRFWKRFFDGADPLKKVQEIRHAWRNHWQTGTEAQKLDAKPWKIRSLREKEEVLPPMRIKELQHKARSYKSSTGVGTNGFHTKLPLDPTEGCTFSRKCNSAVFGKNRQAPRCSSWFQRTSPARADCFDVYFDSLLGVDDCAVISRVEIEMGGQVGCDMKPQWRNRKMAWETLLATEKHDVKATELDAGAVHASWGLCESV